MILPLLQGTEDDHSVYVIVRNTGDHDILVGEGVMYPDQVDLCEDHDRRAIKQCEIKIIRGRVEPGGVGIAKLLSALFRG